MELVGCARQQRGGEGSGGASSSAAAVMGCILRGLALGGADASGDCASAGGDDDGDGEGVS